MTRAMDTPFFEDAQGRRRQTSRTTRHAVRSHLHVAQLDEESLDDAVLPIVPHDVGRKSSPKPKAAPAHPTRAGSRCGRPLFGSGGAGCGRSVTPQPKLLLTTSNEVAEVAKRPRGLRARLGRGGGSGGRARAWG